MGQKWVARVDVRAMAIVSLCVSLVEFDGSRNRPGQEAAVDVDVEASKIDLDTANLFHLRLRDICVTHEFRVIYNGPLSVLTQSDGLRRGYTDRGARTWWVFEREEDINNGKVLFQILVGTKKSSGTVGSCSINGKTLYLRVPYIVGKKTVDDVLPQLRGSSVRRLIDKLAHEPKPAG